ncbi:hypothetical protein GQ457_07G010560 [Hibiscus cannabinus]
MVETRSQSAMVTLETQATATATTDQNPLPEWKHETNRLQSEVNRLESSLEDKFHTMQVTMMANLHKLLEIGLEKKIDTGGLVTEQAGILGSQPAVVAEGKSSRATEVQTQPTKTPVIVIADTENRELKGFESVPDQAKIRVVMLHLEGKALQWHQFLAKSNGDLNRMSWNEYVKQMRERFAPGGFDDPFVELVALKQLETVEKFYEDFIHLLNQVQLPDDYVLSLFKNHLRIEIGAYVKLLQPKNLMNAFHLARHVESMLFPTQKRATWSLPRLTSPPSLSIPSRISSGFGKSNFTSGSTSGPPVAKNITPGSLSPTSSKPTGTGLQKGAGKMISANEIEERRRKGLCFWCVAKYSPGHKCQRSQLYQIMVEGIEEDGEQEEFLDCEEGGDVENNDSHKLEGVVLSLQAMWGKSHWETMKLPVTIRGVSCIALVDSGSTHNFISFSMVKRVGLGIDKRNQLKVIVADGNSMGTLGKCLQVEWRAQGKMFMTDFLVLPLKNCDVVLGVQWLSG